MRKIQFGTELILQGEKNKGYKILKYYLLETPVGFGCSKLKSYGIGIMRTDRIPGMSDMSECKQIEGIFFDIDEAISYIAKMKKEAVLPTELSVALERLISEKVKKQREQYAEKVKAN